MQSRRTRERCEMLADHILESGCTVRAAALYFGISKSTVHKDVTHTLKKVNKSLYTEVQALLLHNKEERHLRGGEATKLKYSGEHHRALAKRTNSV